jgi:hypothetical protein
MGNSHAEDAGRSKCIHAYSICMFISSISSHMILTLPSPSLWLNMLASRLISRYCSSCLDRYGVSVDDFIKDKSKACNWRCPACQRVCTCAACLRKPPISPSMPPTVSSIPVPSLSSENHDVTTPKNAPTMVNQNGTLHNRATSGVDPGSMNLLTLQHQQMQQFAKEQQQQQQRQAALNSPVNSSSDSGSTGSAANATNNMNTSNSNGNDNCNGCSKSNQYKSALPVNDPQLKRAMSAISGNGNNSNNVAGDSNSTDDGAPSRAVKLSRYNSEQPAAVTQPLSSRSISHPYCVHVNTQATLASLSTSTSSYPSPVASHNMISPVHRAVEVLSLPHTNGSHLPSMAIPITSSSKRSKGTSTASTTTSSTHASPSSSSPELSYTSNVRHISTSSNSNADSIHYMQCNNNIVNNLPATPTSTTLPAAVSNDQMQPQQHGMQRQGSIGVTGSSTSMVNGASAQGGSFGFKFSYNNLPSLLDSPHHAGVSLPMSSSTVSISSTDQQLGSSSGLMKRSGGLYSSHKWDSINNLLALDRVIGSGISTPNTPQYGAANSSNKHADMDSSLDFLSNEHF